MPPRHKRRSGGGSGGAQDKILLEDKLKAWKECDYVRLTALDEVPWIPFETWLVDSYVLSFPPDLTPARRKAIHDVAGLLGLAHASVGEGEERHILVSRDDELLSLEVDNDDKDVDVGNSTASSSPVRTHPPPRWYDERVLTKPRVRHYFQRPPSSAALAQEAALLLRMTSYFGLHPDTRLRLPRINDHEEGSLRHSRPFRPEDSVLVDTVEALLLAAHRLSSCAEIAFDCEAHQYRSFHGLTCLLQLSGGGVNFVVDTLAVWDSVGPTLRPLFANPKIVKIGHAIMGGDVPGLHRDFGIIVVNCFDTQVACSVLGAASGVGLSTLLPSLGCPEPKEIEMVKASMKHTDWRLRPLSRQMLAYAALDVHYLVDVYSILCRRLLRAPSLITEWPDAEAEAEDEDEERAASGFERSDAFHFVDSPLPPGGWEGWNDVPSPVPCPAPASSSSSSSATSAAARGGGAAAFTPSPMQLTLLSLGSPSSVVTEQETRSDEGDDYTEERVGRGGGFDQTCLMQQTDGHLIIEDYSNAKPLSVAPSAVALVETAARELANNTDLDALFRVLVESAKIASTRLFKPPVYSDKAHSKEDGYRRRARRWDDLTLRVYKGLHRWRWQVAETIDDGLHYLASPIDLYVLAERKPSTQQDLDALWEKWRALPGLASPHLGTAEEGVLKVIKRAVAAWTNEQQQDPLSDLLSSSQAPPLSETVWTPPPEHETKDKEGPQDEEAPKGKKRGAVVILTCIGVAMGALSIKHLWQQHPQ